MTTNLASSKPSLHHPAGRLERVAVHAGLEHLRIVGSVEIPAGWEGRDWHAWLFGPGDELLLHILDHEGRRIVWVPHEVAFELPRIRSFRAAS